MPPIHFFAEGEPKPQPRVKARNMGAHAGVYTPSTAAEWKERIAIAARPFVPAAPITSPLKVTLGFRFARPRGHYRSGKRAHELRDNAPQYHTGRYDCDNLAKAVMDQLTVIRMWHDDGQVAVLRVTKMYESGPIGCYVTIEELNEAEQ